jgi:hypothetical protein
MEEKQPSRYPGRRDERRLLRIAAQSVKADFPNPERLGCPGSDSLKAIARRRISLTQADDVVDHIATCAPCFDEYADHRRRHRVRVIGVPALAFAAILVAIFVVWRFVPAHQLPPQVARESPGPVLKATLDFRNRTVERSDRTQSPNPAETPHLRRALVDVTVKLPIGTEDGRYSLQLRTGLDQPVVNTTGTVTWDGSAETLTSRVDLRSLAPGEYTLGIRRNGGSSWRIYSVILD